MAKKSTFLEVLTAAPWWVSVILAVLAYLSAKAAPGLIHTNSPLLAAVNVLADLASRNAHFVAMFFLAFAAVSALSAFQRRRLLDEQSDLEDVRGLTWQQFELLVGEAYRRQGYAVTEVGGGGADGGVDLRLHRDGKTTIVQCKRWKSRQVGVSHIRELYGVMRAENADGAHFVSSGAYTPDARRFAEDNGVQLIDGPALMNLIRAVQPASPPAEAAPSAETAPSSPPCPACGGIMIQRTARRGQNVGKVFWGCETFPHCRGVVEA